MRRLSDRRRLGRASAEPAARYLGQRVAHLRRTPGARRAAGVARQLRLGVPARAWPRAPTAARRRRREQPRALGAAARNARRARRASRPVADERHARSRRSTRARGRYRNASRHRGDLASGLPRARPDEKSRSASGTGSAIRRSRAAAFPAPIRTKSRSRPGEFVLGYPDEIERAVRRCRSPTCSGATEPTSSSASCISASRRSADT